MEIFGIFTSSLLYINLNIYRAVMWKWWRRKLQFAPRTLVSSECWTRQLGSAASTGSSRPWRMTTSRTTPTRASPSWASGCLSLITTQTLVRQVEEEGDAGAGVVVGGKAAGRGKSLAGSGLCQDAGLLGAPLAPLTQALSQSEPQFPFLCVE